MMGTDQFLLKNQPADLYSYQIFSSKIRQAIREYVDQVQQARAREDSRVNAVNTGETARTTSNQQTNRSANERQQRIDK